MMKGKAQKLFYALNRILSPTFLLFFIIIATRIAQSQGQFEGSAPRHILSGLVVNSVTGTPISRALVRLSGQSSQYVMTDADGVFRFEGVAEGLVSLDVEKPGFFKLSEEFPESQSRSGFRVGGDLSGIAVKLVPEADLSGHVRSIQGSPIENFPIRVYRRTIEDGAVQCENVAIVNSDHDGYFRIDGMPEESVIISAGPEWWRQRPSGAKNVGYPLLFYPNARAFSAASILTVLPGQHLETDFSIGQESLFEISGIVLGVPEAIDAKVELSTIAGDPVLLGQPHPQRHEFFGYVTSGQYLLRVSAEINGKTLHAFRPLTITSNLYGVQVTLELQSSITVNVRSEVEKNNYGDEKLLTAAVGLVSTNTLVAPIRLTAQYVRRLNETIMEISGASPGTYCVKIVPESGYVEAANSGLTDLLQNDLVVPEGGQVPPIEILLASDGGRLSGTVNMADRTSATVLLVPAAGGSRTIQAAIVAPPGNFLFEQVRPGDYLLLAFDRVDDLEYRNPAVLSKFLSDATRVTVSSRQQVATTVDLIRLRK